MKNLCCILNLGVTLTVFTAFGQRIPYGLQLAKVQAELVEKTAQFDSLVFVGKSSYWNEDLKIVGLGFVDNSIKKVIIHFSKDTTSFYDIKVHKIKKNRLRIVKRQPF